MLPFPSFALIIIYTLPIAGYMVVNWSQLRKIYGCELDKHWFPFRWCLDFLFCLFGLGLAWSNKYILLVFQNLIGKQKLVYRLYSNHLLG